MGHRMLLLGGRNKVAMTDIPGKSEVLPLGRQHQAEGTQRLGNTKDKHGCSVICLVFSLLFNLPHIFPGQEVRVRRKPHSYESPDGSGPCWSTHTWILYKEGSVVRGHSWGRGRKEKKRESSPQEEHPSLSRSIQVSNLKKFTLPTLPTPVLCPPADFCPDCWSCYVFHYPRLFSY